MAGSEAPPDEIMDLLAQGEVHQHAYRINEARQCNYQILHLVATNPELFNPSQVSTAKQRLGVLDQMTHKYPEALIWLERARDTADHISDGRLKQLQLGRIHRDLAESLSRLGREDEAEYCFTEAMRTFGGDVIWDRAEYGVTEGYFGGHLLRFGDLDGALRMLEESTYHLVAANHQPFQIYVSPRYLAALVLSRQKATAESVYRQAIELAKSRDAAGHPIGSRKHILRLRLIRLCTPFPWLLRPKFMPFAGK